jgi:hypothetical protein
MRPREAHIASVKRQTVESNDAARQPIDLEGRFTETGCYPAPMSAEYWLTFIWRPIHVTVLNIGSMRLFVFYLRRWRIRSNQPTADGPGHSENEDLRGP